jgi:hypothetical protein
MNTATRVTAAALGAATIAFLAGGCALQAGATRSPATQTAATRQHSDTSPPMIVGLPPGPTAPPSDPLLGALRRHNPYGYSIVSLLERVPPKIGGTSTTGGGVLHPDGVMRPVDVSRSRFRGWIISEDSLEQLSDICRAVHEETHALQAYYPYVLLRDSGMDSSRYSDYSLYPLSPDEGVLVRRIREYSGQIPSVAILENLVPPEARNGRYEPYIKGKQAHDGVFGLMDEYNAYYQNTTTAYDLFTYVRDEMPDDLATWDAYLAILGFSYYDAYAEFRCFILAYMTALRDQAPAMYRSLLDARGVSTAFARIDARYTELMAAVDRRLRTEIPDLLRARGYSVAIKETSMTPVAGAAAIPVPMLEVRKDSSYKRRAIGTGASIVLRPELARPAYSQMAATLYENARTGAAGTR